MTARPLRVLSIGHSYVVTLNRRLAQAMSAVGGGEWDVTIAAPRTFRGDLARAELRGSASELAGVVGLPVHLSRSPHAFFYGRGLSELLARGWHVVHCWEEPFVAAGAQIAWRTPRGTPLVYFTCQNLSKDYPFPFSKLERYAVGRASGWIGAGQTVVATLRDRSVWRDRPHRQIPFGVDTEAFRPDEEAGRSARRRLGWSDGPPVVGFLGRFVEEKGIELLTRTLDQVRAPWRALLVGGGPLEARLQAWAAPHGDRVRIVTGTPHEEVPQLLNAMDILCAPSQTTPRWREQFGRMLIEAFACGVAVIGSDSGEIPFVLGDAGVVLGERDAPGWIVAIERLLDAHAARRELAARGLERARSTYAWPVVARRYLDFFSEIAGP